MITSIRYSYYYNKLLSECITSVVDDLGDYSEIVLLVQIVRCYAEIRNRVLTECASTLP